jgi:hypothetical protein
VPIDAGMIEIHRASTGHLRLRDISVEGLYAEAGEGQCLDTAVTLSVEFCLPGDNEPIWALCDVVRDDRVGVRDGHALRFQQLSARDRARIERYVEHYHKPIAAPLARVTPTVSTRQVVMFRAVSDLLC